MRHEREVHCAVFSPDGSRIVTTSWDRTTRIWDAATTRPIGEPFHDAGELQGAAFSPDGARVVVGSSGRLQIWDLPRRLGPPPEWLGDLVAVISGYEYSASGELREIPMADRVERAKRLPDSGTDRHGWPRLLKAAGL